MTNRRPAEPMKPRQAMSLAVMCIEHCRSEFPDIDFELTIAAQHVRSLKATTPPPRPGRSHPAPVE